MLDTKRMLGQSLLVVGTNAFAAYEIEAGGRFLVGWDATEDFDLAWTGKQRTSPIQRALPGVAVSCACVAPDLCGQVQGRSERALVLRE